MKYHALFVFEKAEKMKLSSAANHSIGGALWVKGLYYGSDFHFYDMKID